MEPKESKTWIVGAAECVWLLCQFVLDKGLDFHCIYERATGLAIPGSSVTFISLENTQKHPH